MLNINSTKTLSLEEIKKLAPSIFSSTPSPKVSEKYSFLPTDKIIKDMDLLGWKVVDVREVKARSSNSIGYQKHLVVFRNEDVFIDGGDGEDKVYPQILLTNSYDGKNSFTFECGLFRMVCENGLIVSDANFERIKLRHMGYSFEELQSKIEAVLERLPLAVESMNKMVDTKLQQEQMIEFAKNAVKTRFTEKELSNITIDIQHLLEPTRKQDTGDDVWSVYNLVQEKIINGNLFYSNGKKTRKARKIKNFNQDIKINKELFELAYSYVG